MTAIAPVLQSFFTDRLMTQLHASPHTIASYRDTMRLLLAYASRQHGKEPSALDFADLDAPVIGAFLTSLETGRGNGVTTRNARLTAARSLFRYASPVRPRACRSHRPGPGHPRKAPPPPHGLLPHPRRDRRPAGRARHRDLDRPP
jgi:site-specific recombinase XerC